MGVLKGKIALVTGGATGIGAAITKELAAQGCKVIYHYFRSSPDEMKKELDAMGAETMGVQGDLTDEEVVKKVFQQITEKFGALDIVINNAGDLIARHSLAEMELSFFQKVMAVNVDSMMLVSKHAIPLLTKAEGGSSIVNIASLAGRKGGSGGSLAYSTSKGATLVFTRSLAAELAKQGVRVNAVAPGLILATNFHNTHTPAAAAQNVVNTQIPLGRAGTSEDVARAVAYLASEYDGFITGATLDINGGALMM